MTSVIVLLVEHVVVMSVVILPEASQPVMVVYTVDGQSVVVALAPVRTEQKAVVITPVAVLQLQNPKSTRLAIVSDMVHALNPTDLPSRRF